MRLRGRTYRLALTAHVLAAVGWFGVALGVAACGVGAAGDGGTVSRDVAYRVIRVAPVLTIPLGGLAALTGGLLGIGTRHGLVRYWWVVAKIVLTIAVVVTDALVVRAVAGEAVASGSAPAALYGSTVAHVLVLGVATWLSVFKPGGPTPYGRRRTRSGSAGDR